jgi:hypothetical protein
MQSTNSRAKLEALFVERKLERLMNNPLSIAKRLTLAV